MLIHIARNGERHGPYAIEQIRELLSEGSLLPSDLAYNEESAEWIPLSHFVESNAAPTSLPYKVWLFLKDSVWPFIKSVAIHIRNLIERLLGFIKLIWVESRSLDEATETFESGPNDPDLIADYCLTNAIWPYIWVGTFLLASFIGIIAMDYLGCLGQIILLVLAFCSFRSSGLLWGLTERFPIRWWRGCQFGGNISFIVPLVGYFLWSVLRMVEAEYWASAFAPVGYSITKPSTETVVGFITMVCLFFIICHALIYSLLGIRRGWLLFRDKYSGPSKIIWIVGMVLCSINVLGIILMSWALLSQLWE